MKAIDAEERDAMAEIARKAEVKRSRLVPRYDSLMNRIVAFLRAGHPEVFNGRELETDEVTVSYHRDGNGTLEVPDPQALVAYLKRHSELRRLVKVVESLASSAEFKRWWRKNPRRRPPAKIKYNNSISVTLKPSQTDRELGIKPVTLVRVIDS
jgi:hypothetical protein